MENTDQPDAGASRDRSWSLTEHMHHALQPVWFYTPCGWHLVDLLLLNYGLWHVGSLEAHDKSLALLGPGARV